MMDLINKYEGARRIEGAEKTHPAAHPMRRTAGAKRLGVPIVVTRVAVLFRQKETPVFKGGGSTGVNITRLGVTGFRKFPLREEERAMRWSKRIR
jgi:hypothetical protein